MPKIIIWKSINLVSILIVILIFIILAVPGLADSNVYSWYSLGTSNGRFTLGNASNALLALGSGQTIITPPSSTVFDITNYPLLDIAVRISPVILFFGLLFGGPLSVYVGIKRRKDGQQDNLIWIVLGSLAVIIVLTMFPAIMSGFNNILTGNW